MQEIQYKYNRLCYQFWRHSHLYYTLNTPEIDDFEFDLLLRQIEAMEQEHPHLKTDKSPSQTLYCTSKCHFCIAHKYSSLSVNNDK